MQCRPCLIRRRKDTKGDKPEAVDGELVLSPPAVHHSWQTRHSRWSMRVGCALFGLAGPEHSDPDLVPDSIGRRPSLLLPLIDGGSWPGP